MGEGGCDMPLPTRFERDVQNIVGTKMDLDPTTIEGRMDTMQSEIDGKANINHTHSIAQVTGLQAALNSKASVSSVDALTEALTDMSALVANKADIVDSALQLPVCASTLLPNVSPAGRLVFVSDLSVLAFTDGVSWLNVQTGAAI